MMLFRPFSRNAPFSIVLLCVAVGVPVAMARPAFAGPRQAGPHAAFHSFTRSQSSTKAPEIAHKGENNCGGKKTDIGEPGWSPPQDGRSASSNTAFLFRRGRRYDALPKMDHFACKSDGLCIRPVGEKSLRVGLRSGESEIVVEAVYAGDGTVGPDSPSQWCLRLSDRGLGAIASIENGQCPDFWATENKHPLFTPTESILADARSQVDVVGRRRVMVARMTKLLATSSAPLGKEHATRQAFFFLKHYGSTSPLRSIHDETVADLAGRIPPAAGIEFDGSKFQQRN